MSDGPGHRILTPEHVPIDLLPAGIGSRFLALLVDFFLIVSAAMALSLLISVVVPFGLAPAVSTAAVFALTWSYPVYFEVRRQGQTPGKRMFRLRVVDGRGLPITPSQSFVRNILRVLDFLPLFYGFGALVCLLDPLRRRLGDIAADTLVIQERPPLEAPRALAGVRRFNSLRSPRVLRLIRHRVGLEEREFLLSLCLRIDRMEERARYDLLETVAARYRRDLGIEDPHLSGENLVRDLTAILYGQEAQG